MASCDQQTTGEVTYMMRIFEPDIYAMLFRMVANRLQPPPRHRFGGCRKRISDEICFTGLLRRFISADAWETVEADLRIIGNMVVSDTTLRSRRTEWEQAGVFHQLMEDCLAIYHELIGIDMSHVAIDGSSQLAPGGGRDTNNSPGSKGRKTMKWSIGVDANGIGLGGVIVSGSANDYPLLQPTLDTITARDWTAAIDTLLLDRGYGYPSLPTKLERHQINHVDVTMRNKPGQGRVVLAGIKRRWKIERTNSWLTNFKQLKINHDRTVEHRLAALQLGMAILIIYRITDHLNQNHLPLESIR
jgi:transposase